MLPQKKEDIRVKRAKSLLYKSLLILMKQKKYKDISIKELTETAEIARPSFYRYYKTIDEILIAEMDASFDKYIELIRSDVVNYDFSTAADKLFEGWKGDKDLFEAIQKADIFYKIADRFDEYAMRIAKLAVRSKKISVEFTYSIHFYAGGMYMVLRKWQQNDMKTPKSVIKKLLVRTYKFLLPRNGIILE